MLLDASKAYIHVSFFIPSWAATSGKYVALRFLLSGSVNSKIIPCMPIYQKHPIKS